MDMTQDFWLTSGWHLLDRDSDGRLVPSADFMLAYYARDEIAPQDESCPAERALHARLSEDPFAEVSEEDFDPIIDRDVVHNYRAVLAFRAFLAQYPTLEAAYIAIVRGAKIDFPPLFVEQLTQIILRNILDGETDTLKIRAAECLFRQQTVTLDDGCIMVADHATVQLQAGMARMLKEGPSPDEVSIDILATETADEYWSRSDMFNTSVDIAFTQPALDGLCRVMEAWINYFLGVTTRIQPMHEIEDESWSWHIGLDTVSNDLFNDLYNGADVGEDRLSAILCLFKLESEDGFLPEMAGRPVYLGLAMDQTGSVRMKAQNLLANLPLATS
jgi:hypothetical protein